MIVIPSFRGLVARVFAAGGPESGSLYAWGYNGQNVTPAPGQLGIRNTTNQSSPTLVFSGSGWSGPESGWTEISSGKQHSVGINSGKLYTWGDNYYGRLGLWNKTTTYRVSYPVQVGSSSDWSFVAAGRDHVLAIRSNGSLWSWGNNSNGQLGLNDYDKRSSPTQISSSGWSFISAGDYHSFAIKTDGSLWSWGNNGFGQLGLGDSNNRISPVQVEVGTSWIMVSGGRYHSLGIRANKSLWAWGRNDNYQLGIGNSYYYSLPVQVGSSTDWDVASAGGYHSLGVRNSGVSGTLWSWGRNDFGQLGLNTSGAGTYKSVPDQIGSSGWISASAGRNHSGAINSSEKMFFWGRNKTIPTNANGGQVGDNTFTDKSSPVPISSSVNWLKIASMRFDSSFAIKKQ